MAENFHDKSAGCLVGLALGDAIGAPFQTMTAKEIAEFTDDVGVTGVQPGPFSDDPAYPTRRAGRTTNDTRLALCLARSLIERDQFVARDMAWKLAREYFENDVGWSDGMKSAAKAFLDWYDSNGDQGRAPEFPAPCPKGDPSSSDNGVAVCVAPLALHFGKWSHDDEPILSYVMELGLMTHGDPRASFGAAVVATVVQWLLRCCSPEHAVTHIEKLKKLVYYRADVLECRYRHYRSSEDRLSERITRMYGALSDAETLRMTCGTSSFVNESVPLALGIYLRHPTDLRAGILEAVNAGGDTDTTAAMVGAMIGANTGMAGIPREWYDAVRVCGYVEKVARSLMDPPNRHCYAAP